MGVDAIVSRILSVLKPIDTFINNLFLIFLVLNMDQPLKTGTTTIGIVCKDAVIVAADRKATAGHLIAHKKMKKIVKVSDMMAVTTAGVVSDIQLLVKLLRAELSLKETQTGRKVRVVEAANLLSGMCYRAIRQPTMLMAIASFMLRMNRAGGLPSSSEAERGRA